MYSSHVRGESAVSKISSPYLGDGTFRAVPPLRATSAAASASAFLSIMLLLVSFRNFSVLLWASQHRNVTPRMIHQASAVLHVMSPTVPDSQGRVNLQIPNGKALSNCQGMKKGRFPGPFSVLAPLPATCRASLSVVCCDPLTT